MLTWDDDPARPNLGEGISRTSSPAAALWSVDVGFDKGPGMRTTVRAKSKGEAKKFTRNRYPTATIITVNGKAH
jgi:hypothetical protein